MYSNHVGALDVLAIILMLAFAFIAHYLDWYGNYSGFAMIPLMLFYYLGKYFQKKQNRKQGE